MKFIAKLFNVDGVPASDSSIIERRVAEEYLASDKFKEDLRSRRLLGTLTHAARNLGTASGNINPEALKGTIGKDDLLITLNQSAPTHVLTNAWIESDGWVYGSFDVLDETYLDDDAVQRIKRLKGLLTNGCKIGISCVIVGYWQQKDGHDRLAKFVSLKGADITLNPSWVDAGITKIIYDDEHVEDRAFSSTTRMFSQTSGKIKVKSFSGVAGEDLKKSSKIDGAFTVLKAKVYSFNSDVRVSESESGFGEKTFSVATIKERLRYAKMSPRQRFRYLILDYRKAIKAEGGVEKMDSTTLDTLKSLFTTDVLDIMKSITSDIIAGKQINTLIGASSLGKVVRVAAQKLQVPFRQAFQESQRQKFVSKQRYQKIQDCYMEFIQALIEDTFGVNPSEIPGEDADSDETN